MSFPGIVVEVYIGRTAHRTMVRYPLFINTCRARGHLQLAVGSKRSRMGEPKMLPFGVHSCPSWIGVRGNIDEASVALATIERHTGLHGSPLGARHH